MPGAESRCRQALQLAPADAELLSVLGVVLLTQKRYSDAEATFDQLSAMQPDEPSHWSNLGTARRGARNLDGALAALARAAHLGANSADFYFNVALTHIDRRDFESARAVLAQALPLAPQDAEMRLHYANSCYERLKTDEALAALDGWERMDGLTGAVISGIGQLLMKLGVPQRAEVAIRRAIAIDPADPHSTLTLIQLLERTNRLSEAHQEMQCLESNPLSSQLGSDLKLLRAQLAQRAGDHATAIVLFGELLAESNEFELRHLLEFPLAKSLDAEKRFDQAFEVLLAAHRSQAALLQMTAPVLSARGAPSMVITRFGCDPQDVAAWDDAGAPSIEASPVFIVAFPRSGTTLLELTLDSHPALVSMDEQPLVQKALDDLTAEGVTYPEAMRGLTTEQLDRVPRRLLAPRSAACAARRRSTTGRQESVEYPATGCDPPVVSERTHRSRHPASLRRHAELLHAAFPHSGLRTVMQRSYGPGRGLSAHVRFLVCTERAAAAACHGAAL